MNFGWEQIKSSPVCIAQSVMSTPERQRMSATQVRHWFHCCQQYKCLMNWTFYTADTILWEANHRIVEDISGLMRASVPLLMNVSWLEWLLIKVNATRESVVVLKDGSLHSLSQLCPPIMSVLCCPSADSKQSNYRPKGNLLLYLSSILDSLFSEQ